jgi:ABC-type branched-subunit amino acid transport system substrate-binding protein
MALKGRMARISVLVLASMTVAAACSSVGGASVTTQAGNRLTASSNTPTQGVTSNSIKVGGVEVVNGQGYSYSDVCSGAQVEFKAVNAAGGVNGRKINFTGCLDDGGTTTADNSQTTRLVEQEKVFAIVPASIIFSGASIAQQANVPYFGWGISPYFCNNKQGFGFNGCTGPSNPNWTDTSWATMLKKIDPSIKRVAIQSLAIPTTETTAKAAVRGFTAEGLKTVYQDLSIPLTGVSDYTPYVQKILAANPQAVVLQVQSAIPLISALRSAGYKGITVDAVDDSAQLLQNPSTAQALQGSYVVTSFSPYPGNAGMKQMRANAKKYGTSSTVVDDSFAQGYFSAAMFIDMVKKTGKNLTYNTFYKTANNSGYCYNGNGAMGSVCYPIGHTDYTGCVALVQVHNAGFIPKVPITCSTGPGNNASKQSK